MNKTALVLFLGIIMIGSTYSISSSFALPQNLPDVSQVPFKVRVIEGNGFTAFVKPLYTVADNPSLHETGAGGVHDGVAKLLLTRTDFDAGCSGALLTTGIHVLTAAHCVTEEPDEFPVPVDFEPMLVLISGSVTFEGDFGTTVIDIVVSETAVHPDWNGDLVRGNDVAILTLEREPPVEIERYDIDRDGSNDVFSVADKVGYGISGFGATGADSGDFPFGDKRNGLNKYDDTHDTMWNALGLVPVDDYVPGAVLQYDFDNGKGKNDAFGFFFGNKDNGLGNDEVNSAPGDSGGPSRTSALITGITSYGVSLISCNPVGICRTSDVTPGVVDSSFGEFSGDTRVSKYFSFIDDVTGAGGEDVTPPDTTITSNPPDPTSSTDATFEFTGSDDVTAAASLTFQCKLDASAFTSCTSPKTYSAQAEGSHTFQVRAIDAASNVDPSPASFTWTVDTSVPTSVIVSSISKTEIVKGTTIQVTILGSGFVSGASVTFENGCGPSPSAVNVSDPVSSTSITADITAKSGGPPKDCAFVVRVTNPGGSTGVLSQLFTVLG